MSSLSKPTLPASIWMTNAGVKNARNPPAMFPKIENVKNQHYDAIVVGGGIFGVTTAYLLKQSGKRVALLEGRTISGGTTGFSTAKLSAQQGPTYSMISSKRGNKVAKSYYDMNIQGIRKVEQLMTDLKIECEYEKRPHITWTGQANSVSTIQKEHATCLECGIPARLLNAEDLRKELPVSLNPQLAVAFDDMAQFNSYKFVCGLAKHVDGDGSVVYEHSRVTNVSENPFSPITGKPGHDVDLEYNDTKLTADNVILATHLPIMDRSLHFSFLEPSRSFAAAVRVKNQNMRFMSMSADPPVRSMRTGGTDNDVIVILGESCPMGEMTDTDVSYTNIENWAREHFDVTEVVSRWSAMDYTSSDHTPYIGYLYRGTDTIYTGTGWSKWGLAMGVAGAQLVTDLINGVENPHFDTVDARRVDLNTLQGLGMEGTHLAKHLVGDKVKQAIAPGGNIASLQPGQGSVCKAGLKTVGAYRDEDGGYHIVEPVCTHLACNVVFNQGDRLWDCPCHGSQFGVDGEVVHGPAVKPLKVIKDLEW